jgi:hypothetical protein
MFLWDHMCRPFLALFTGSIVKGASFAVANYLRVAVSTALTVKNAVFCDVTANAFS